MKPFITFDKVTVTMIACVARNRVIGKGDELVFDIKDDMNFFKRTTSPGVVIMGRKTFETLRDKHGNIRPLANRVNIVITSDEEYNLGVEQGVRIVHSVEEALEKAKAFAVANDFYTVFVIGGQSIYEACLPHANKMILTEVDADAEGDVFFPEFDRNVWKVDSKIHSQEGDHTYAFVNYYR